MTKLKKLFPLSFAFKKNPVMLFVGILIYLVANSIVIGLINLIPTVLMLPLFLFAIPYLGWILLFLLLIPVLLYLFFIILLSNVLTYVAALINIYTYAGIAVSFVAYAKCEESAVEIAAEETVDAE